MSDKAHPLAQIATRSLFENDDVRIWEMDVGPGETFGLHHHSNDYILYIIGGADLAVDDQQLGSYVLKTRERAVYYVPAGGTESFRNVSESPFREALIEIKRPPRAGQERPGLAVCEALAATVAQPGTVPILENGRVRITETTLEPGQGCGMRQCGRDTAVFVVQAGRVRVIERRTDSGEHVSEEAREPGAVRWESRGAERAVVNLGPGPYRQISVEIK